MAQATFINAIQSFSGAMASGTHNCLICDSNHAQSNVDNHRARPLKDLRTAARSVPLVWLFGPVIDFPNALHVLSTCKLWRLSPLKKQT